MIFFVPLGLSQSLSNIDINEDDLNIGGDIFSDFNEDIENAKVMEDERFYRYGRFVSLNVSLGLTMFDGNRGFAYSNDNPSYGMSVTFFSDFKNAYVLGLAFSKHYMLVDEAVVGFQDTNGAGLIRINMLRSFFGYRFYLDTSDFGTAITYSNPYFVTRIEYWYITNKYEELTDRADDSGGGFGLGLGAGLEFPIKIKESYIGVELLWHTVNFHDKWTKLYAPIDGSSFGFDDLSGNSWTFFTSYTLNW